MHNNFNTQKRCLLLQTFVTKFSAIIVCNCFIRRILSNLFTLYKNKVFCLLKLYEQIETTNKGKIQFITIPREFI